MSGNFLAASFYYLPQHSELYIRYPDGESYVDYQLENCKVLAGNPQLPVVKFWEITPVVPRQDRLDQRNTLRFALEPGLDTWSMRFGRRTWGDR
jgi:hypothetical protein